MAQSHAARRIGCPKSGTGKREVEEKEGGESREMTDEKRPSNRTGQSELMALPQYVEQVAQKAPETGNRPPQRLLDVKETARYLKISPRSIYNRIGAKSKRPFPVKPRRVGRLVRFDIRDLDAYIEGI